METMYLTIAKQDGKVVRECWAKIMEHGQSMTAAEALCEAFRELWPMFEYEVHPVTMESVRKHVRA